MKLSVERMDNKDEKFDLDLQPYYTVKWIKAMLMAKTGDPLALQHLFFDGKELEDHMEIQKSNIHDDSTLYLVVDPDPTCALVSRIDNIAVLLKDISKAKVFRKI